MNTSLMEPVVPSIRSSDYECLLGDPFRYFLTRRLGIRPALSSSQALARGSWFHVAAEYDDFHGLYSPSHPGVSRFYTLLDKRVEELTETCARLGIVGDARRTIVATEREDAETALAWYSAASRVVITPTIKTFRDYFSRPFWKVLGREVPASFPHRYDFNPALPLARRTTFDLLVQDLNTNLLWVVDWKTCSEPTTVRLASCPIEYQTLHSLYLLEDLLKTGIVSHHFPSVNEDTKVGGMIHVAIQKPSLRFGQQDRDFTLDTSPLKSGPRKGQPRNEKNFHGEPKLANFLARCEDWYQGIGDYTHLQPERNASPTVNISHTYFHKLDEEARSDYLARTEFIGSHAIRDPVPSNFLKSASNIAPYGTLSPYAPFYLCPPSQWPEIMHRDNFTIEHRDLSPQSVLHPTPLIFPSPSTQDQAQIQGESPQEGTPLVGGPGA